MNNFEIGKYIKSKRIGLHLTQKDLAEKLQVSFQAVSKWETGTTLPDTSLLMLLSDILEVTVDQILSAGEFRKKMNKKINIEEIEEALDSILKIKKVLGANNGIYNSMMSGLINDAGASFEEQMSDANNREIFVAKAVIQLIIDGYYVVEDELDSFFTKDGYKEKIVLYQKKYNQSK
jgi:transcriptional regulator with XRE-family HTH domain